jgi:cbb3-type cytochrome oxidase subunit 3
MIAIYTAQLLNDSQKDPVQTFGIPILLLISILLILYWVYKRGKKYRGSRSPWWTFWNGLTYGEKSVFPVFSFIFIGLVFLAIYSAISGQRFSGAAAQIAFILFVFLVWMYSRGKKNNPNN